MSKGNKVDAIDVMRRQHLRLGIDGVLSRQLKRAKMPADMVNILSVYSETLGYIIAVSGATEEDLHALMPSVYAKIFKSWEITRRGRGDE